MVCRMQEFIFNLVMLLEYMRQMIRTKLSNFWKGWQFSFLFSIMNYEIVLVLVINGIEIFYVIFFRLNLTLKRDTYYNFEINSSLASKKLVLPKHIPPHSTLRNLLTHHCDIRATPKKVITVALDL